ncbi:AraC family transcriptional regulator [Psychromonas marina]|nr:helix-turn-helix domain-containing protein [Psychromonas marina]
MIKLLLLIDTMFYYDREVLKGIKSKADECPFKFSIHIESIENAEDILSQQWDYVIADFDKVDRFDVISQLTCHVLIYSSYRIENAPKSVSTVTNDNQYLSCLALGQFIQNDIQNVTFYMDPSEMNAGWAKERHLYFKQHASLLDLNYVSNLQNAVSTKQFPLGVYCASDRSARKLVDFCTRNKISIPGQVSIIGTDYDDAECYLSDVPLTSIYLDPYRLGKKCLQVLLKAKRFNKLLHEKYQPKNVLNENTTMVDSSQDEIVNNALYFLHNNFHTNIKVNHVVDFCKTSRKTLDKRFSANKGMTVHQYLSDLRISKSKKLLRSSSESIESIALQCGYPSQSYLYQVYKKLFDYTPCKYRQNLTIS